MLNFQKEKLNLAKDNAFIQATKNVSFESH